MSRTMLPTNLIITCLRISLGPAPRAKARYRSSNKGMELVSLIGQYQCAAIFCTIFIMINIAHLSHNLFVLNTVIFMVWSLAG